MAASALSVELSLPVLGGDAHPAMRGDDEEGQGQKQQDGEDVGEVSLSQSTLPRRAASRSRSPSAASAVGASILEQRGTLKTAVEQLKQCLSKVESLAEEKTDDEALADKNRQIQLLMQQLRERG